MMARAKPPETFSVDRLTTPIGTALVISDADGALRAFDWEDHAERIKGLLRLQYGAVDLKETRAPKAIRIARIAAANASLLRRLISTARGSRISA